MEERYADCVAAWLDSRHHRKAIMNRSDIIDQYQYNEGIAVVHLEGRLTVPNARSLLRGAAADIGAKVHTRAAEARARAAEVRERLRAQREAERIAAQQLASREPKPAKGKAPPNPQILERLRSAFRTPPGWTGTMLTSWG